MSIEVTFEVESTLKEDPKKISGFQRKFQRFKKHLFDPERMGDRRLIDFKIDDLLTKIKDDENVPEDSIVHVRDMKNVVDDPTHLDLYNRFLIEVRRWDKNLKSYELDHYGFRDMKNRRCQERVSNCDACFDCWIQGCL